jgi:hypothetical protein
MAIANLLVSAELGDAFLAESAELSPLAILRLSVVDTTIQFDGKVEITGDLEAAFGELNAAAIAAKDAADAPQRARMWLLRQ